LEREKIIALIGMGAAVALSCMLWINASTCSSAPGEKETIGNRDVQRGDGTGREKKKKSEYRNMNPEPPNLASGAHTRLTSLITKSLGQNGRKNLKTGWRFFFRPLCAFWPEKYAHYARDFSKLCAKTDQVCARACTKSMQKTKKIHLFSLPYVIYNTMIITFL
jgi:hypothetical protein